MNIRELIEELQQLDPVEAEVILQKDAEGNGYSPLYCTGLGYYVAESTWSGIFYDQDWNAEDCCMDAEEFNEMKAQRMSVVLAPVN